MTQESGHSPRRLGNYEILAEIGSGGLGRVFRACDLRTGRIVAMKFLHDRLISNERILGAFHRELLIISSLHHRHVVSYLDSFFKPPVCFIVTEFIDGWSGKELLKRIPKFPPLVAISIIFDALRGIDYLHLHDTIHSDLSTANFLIEKSGRVLITDFGLSCHMQVEDYKYRMLGTPGYYSPEHISNVGIGPRSDLYCVGLILYELLTGMRAVPPAKDRRETQRRMKRISYEPISVFSDRKLRNELKKTLKMCLHFSPGRRVDSAEKVMIQCYKILKRFDIRFPALATCQFLADARLLPEYRAKPQNIYGGL